MTKHSHILKLVNVSWQWICWCLYFSSELWVWPNVLCLHLFSHSFKVYCQGMTWVYGAGNVSKPHRSCGRHPLKSHTGPFSSRIMIIRPKILMPFNKTLTEQLFWIQRICVLHWKNCSKAQELCEEFPAQDLWIHLLL